MARNIDYKLCSNIANCLKYEIARRWKKATLLFKNELFYDCYKELHIAILLSPSPEKAVYSTRMLCGLPAKFKAVVGNASIELINQRYY